eukprot:CAMPEP_0203716906 /NCGR_PEP_ID=MMETSP0092-20131115/1497_1 /ASSEMBLY_ACC=CAM_ASM_001090 /TAXON_ID=426623 /ORGANISM="Chaetoceros affinis, Strain CCMP159" /LENGTH=78 /DNA_ID=CAMNT_0050595579 /DNA_START=172 /DNA_END=408 /DNA_ORIENTATION=-
MVMKLVNEYGDRQQMMIANLNEKISKEDTEGSDGTVVDDTCTAKRRFETQTLLLVLNISVQRFHEQPREQRRWAKEFS